MNFRSFAINYSGNVGKEFPQFEKISVSTAHVLARFLMSVMDIMSKILMDIVYNAKDKVFIKSLNTFQKLQIHYGNYSSRCHVFYLKSINYHFAIGDEFI